jgi:hypothetical protein
VVSRIRHPSWQKPRCSLFEAIKSLQQEIYEDFKRPLQGSKGLADTHAEEAKKERDAKRKRKRGADDARLDPRAGPIDNARDRNLRDAAEGKEILIELSFKLESFF